MVLTLNIFKCRGKPYEIKCTHFCHAGLKSAINEARLRLPLDIIRQNARLWSTSLADVKIRYLDHSKGMETNDRSLAQAAFYTCRGQTCADPLMIYVIH